MTGEHLHLTQPAISSDAMQLYDKVADKPGFVQYRRNLPQSR